MPPTFLTNLILDIKQPQPDILRWEMISVVNAHILGTLIVVKEVPIRFQSIGLDIEITVFNSISIDIADKLI